MFAPIQAAGYWEQDIAIVVRPEARQTPLRRNQHEIWWNGSARTAD
jgi:hypothetical protein